MLAKWGYEPSHLKQQQFCVTANTTFEQNTRNILFECIRRNAFFLFMPLCIIRNNGIMDDKELVEKLKIGDDVAWNKVYAETICPMCRNDHYRYILRDWGISELDVLGMVYEKLIVKKRIDGFRYESSFNTWVRWEVRGAISQYTKKNDHPVSDSEEEGIYKGNATNPDRRTEELEMVQKCFMEVWKQNPARAYVHLLRTRGNLSAQSVMKLLGITSEDNVNKIFSRAVSDMREARKKICGE